MREHRVESRIGGPIFIFAAGAFLLIAATSVKSQSGPPFAPGSHPDPTKDRIIEMQQREAALRGVGVETAKKSAADTRNVQAAVVQFAQDYKQIQILRNEVVRLIAPDKPLDFKHILDATAEIRKRASRLKAYMVVERQDENEKKPAKTLIGTDDKEIRGALATLCNEISSFVSNPVFKNPGVVEVGQSARLNRDLKSIIELSDEVNKSAEHRRKALE